jgi:hypothetical protein
MSLTHVDPHVSEIVMVWIQSGDLLMVWIQISPKYRVGGLQDFVGVNLSLRPTTM